jgi:hypothetical protein
MGGSGSGRWRNHQKARLVTEVMRIDLRHREWKALLSRDRAEGTLRWSDPQTGSLSGWADFLLAPVNPDGTRNLVLDRTGDEFAPKQVVVLGLRPAGFSRQWFAGCRSCDRWVRTLYAISQSDRFTCRICSNLTYASVQQHDRRLDQARRDPQGFVQSRSRAPKTVRSQLVTASLAYEAQDHGQSGRGWGRHSVTSGTRWLAAMRQDFIDRWGFPPEDSGRIARGG